MIKSITPNLMVEDVNRSIDFYTRLLGFELITAVPNEENGNQFAIVGKDNFILMFQQRTNMIEEYPALSSESLKASSSLYIATDNFNEIYQQIKTEHEIYIDTHKSFYGATEFSTLDPDGYVLTFKEEDD